MTVLLLSENFPPKTGGSGRWFWEIYRRMPREVVAIGAGDDPRQDGFDRTHDLRLERLPLTLGTWGTFGLRGLGGYLRVWRAVAGVIRRHGIERIHCGKILPEGWVARLLKATHRTKYICYVHGEELNYGVRSRELAWMIRRVFAGAEFLVANSRNTAGLLRDRWHVPDDAVRVLNPGVDVARFVPAARDASVRAALGWNDRPVVLTVGRLQERKGQDMLIQAIGAIRQAVSDVLYSIVGDGDQRARLESLVRQSGLQRHVEFRGEVDDQQMIQCYQQCDLFALPNRNVNGDIEGFGMVLLEAQACGKPVIAGASGGTAETMCVGQTGRIVHCEGPDDLGRAVTELLLDTELRTRMGEAGRKRAVERFSWESLAEQARRVFFGEGEGGG